MVDRAEIALYISAKEEATAVLKQVEQQVGLTTGQIRNAGIAMTAAGAAIFAGLGMAAAAAAEEEAGIVRLSQAMRNVGLSYEASREQLETFIDAQQQSTSIADDQQREALATLITMTGDLSKSQEMLTLAMDISAGTGKDLTSVTSTLGYALAGNWGMVNRMIPALAQAQTEEEKWAMLREMFAGQSEAYGKTMAGQYALIKNNLGDVVEAIGGPVISAMNSLLQVTMPVIQAVKQWMADNKTLVTVLVALAAAGGALLLVLGPMLIGFAALPSIIAGARVAYHLLQVTFHAVQGAAISMWGAITLGVSLAIAAGIALYQNWDKVKNWLADLWDNIKIIFSEAVKFLVNTVLQPFFRYIDWVFGTILDALGKVVGFFNKEWGAAIESAADTLHNLDDAVVQWADDLGTAARASKETRATVRDLEASLNDQAEGTRAATGALSEYSDTINGVKAEAESMAETVRLANGELYQLGAVKEGTGATSTVTFGGQSYTSSMRGNDLYRLDQMQAAIQSQAASQETIDTRVASAIEKGLAGIRVEVGGEDVAAVVYRQGQNQVTRIQ